MSYTLIVLLFVCHWLADYTHLQRPWMLKAKMTGTPISHIAVHALVHAVLMSFCLLFFASGELLVFLVFFEWITHFIIDMGKAKANVWFPILKYPTHQFHWIVFGFDQFLHHAIIVLMVYWVYHVPSFL